LFLVNDHADIAFAIDADGVHLGQNDLPVEEARKILGKEKLIGISTHSKEQAREAERSGADYIGFGPVFQTVTKDAGEAQGLQMLSCVKQSVSVPVIAIGGINRANVGDVIRAGADGVAVISAVLSTSDIQQAAIDMLRIIQGAEVEIQRPGGNS
jgi:thiamine-phosphate pyrophosphorylase